MKSRYFRLLVGVLISAVFIWLALRGLHLPDVWLSLRSADYVWLIPSIAVYFLAVGARTWRWDYLLRPIKQISLRRLFPVVVIGYMGNNVYPFRAGEVLRAVVLRQREGVSVSSSLATIIVERVFDGLVMLLFVFVALPFAPLPSDSIRFVVILGSVLFFGALLVFFAVAAVPARFLRLAEWFIGRFVPHRFRAPLLGFAERFVEGLLSLRNPRNLLMIFLTSVVIWLLETVKYWFVMHAFDFTVSFFALMLMNGVVNLATTLPSAPGYIGTFDGPGIAVLTLYGVDPAVATAYTLTLHAALWLPITLLGIYYMVRIQLGWADIGRAVAGGAEAQGSGGAGGQGGRGDDFAPAPRLPRSPAFKREYTMKLAIIGAGIAGLSAAYDLLRAGHSVTLLEGDSQTGGLATGFRDERWEWPLEKFYHHLFTSDRAIIGLVEEIGFRDKLFFPRPTTSVIYEDRIVPFDSPVRWVTFPGFNPLDVARFGLVSAYLRFTKPWRQLEQHTADAWLRRAYGDKIYEMVWRPLLIGKFGPHYEEVNMAWMWARLHVRSPRLGYFEGGFQAFVDRLTEVVRELGGDIRLNCPAQSIRPDGGGLAITAGGATERYDAALVTTSPALLARLAPDLAGDYLRQILELKSMGAVVMTLALKQSLLGDSGTYWLNIPATSPDKAGGLPFLALVEHTNYIDRSHYGGDHILYCGDYVTPDHPYMTMSQEELERLFVGVLHRFNPDFRPDWVRRSWLFRARYAQPVPGLNHSRAIPDLRTPLPGLYFASMSQVYPWDRGTNFAVEIGRRAAGLMLTDAASVGQRTSGERSSSDRLG